MAFDVKIKIKKKFNVQADITTVYQLLSNVPESTSHFPDLENLIEESENTYRWEMKKMGLGPITFQTIYACKYLCDETNKHITWSSAETADKNAIVTGEWILEEADTGCDATLITDAIMTIPLPSLAGIGVKPVAKAEFETLINTYIRNLSTALKASKNTVSA